LQQAITTRVLISMGFGGWKEKGGVYGLIVGLVLSLTACGSLDEARVEQTMLHLLPSLVGPGDYSVDANVVEKFTGDIVNIEQAHVVGKRVARPGSPVLDRVEVDLEGVRVNQQDETLEELKAADAWVWVKASDIAAFLERQPNLKTVSMSFNAPDHVSLSARPVIPGLGLPPAALMKVRGRLVPRGSELWIQVVDMRMRGFVGGGLANGLFEQAINPLVDLSALPASSRLTAVQIKGNTLDRERERRGRSRQNH